jgi:hypothetical protein
MPYLTTKPRQFATRVDIYKNIPVLQIPDITGQKEGLPNPIPMAATVISNKLPVFIVHCLHQTIVTLVGKIGNDIEPTSFSGLKCQGIACRSVGHPAPAERQ